MYSRLFQVLCLASQALPYLALIELSGGVLSFYTLSHLAILTEVYIQL